MFGNEIGRLAQDMPGRNTDTDTIFFIDKSEIPDKRCKDLTYSRLAYTVSPQKKEVDRIRLTFAGQNLDIAMECGTPTANLLTIKLLFNSIVSTPGTKLLRLDVKDFYLNTPMDRPEYLQMKLVNFPNSVIHK